MSKIEWCDATWNPLAGCAKVSPGCANCYAIREARRLAKNPNSKISKVYKGLTTTHGQSLDWTGKVRVLLSRLEQPYTWAKPRRVFVNYMYEDITRINHARADYARDAFYIKFIALARF